MPSTFATERVGVSAAQLEFSRWGWAFREQPIVDFGIDAHVEPFSAGRPSGKLIALQIKSGPSWFSEPTEGGWLFRGSDAHLLYWLRHALPVVLLLHDPEPGITYWAQVTQGAVEVTDAGWKVLIPSSQVLCSEAIEEFAAIAEAAPAASDDPLEVSCGLLPPTTAEALRAAEHAAPSGALRLASWLAAGRATPNLTAESVLSGSPSWLADGRGDFEVALATYASEHGCPHLAAEAFTRAADYDEQPADRLLAYAAISAAEAGDPAMARRLMARVRADPASSLVLATAEAVVTHLGEAGPVPAPAALLAATQLSVPRSPRAWLS